MTTEVEAQKGKLELDIEWEKLEDNNVREVVRRIQAISERVLYHWRSFPVVLPSSIVDDKGICLKDLFILPTFDELDALTTDCKGNPKFLSHNQLQSIKRKGQFTVPSINFPGQHHVWALNPLFQKGIDRAKEEYLDGLAFSLRYILVYAPMLLTTGERFSLKRSMYCLKEDCVELLDLIVGSGKTHVPNLERRIHEERCKYLVAEMKCKGEGAKEIGRYVRNQSQKALREKVTMAMERPPAIPFRFTTPISLDIDLRLFDRDILRKVMTPLGKILEKSSRGWFLSFRERIIAQLKTKKLSDNELELQANIMVMDEYLKRVYNAIRACQEITSLGVDFDRLLIEQAQLYVFMHRAVDQVALKLDSELRNVRKYLTGEYPILARDEVWMAQQLERAQTKFCEDNRWLPHSIALEFCKENFLKQHSYFLARDLAFMRDTEHVLRKELQGDKKPCRFFEWKILIWRPENYVIFRTLYGQTEAIPTVVSRVPTTITNPRSDPCQPVFTVQKSRSLWTSTRWPLWRIQNLLFRSMMWMFNLMLFLGYVIPWCSPISLRALFHSKPFMADLELSQVNGTMCPTKSSQTPTLMSRLNLIWRRVSKARTRFESQPDTGFLGKGWNRFLNRFWNYFCRGFVPSFFLLLFFPLGSLCMCLVSILLAVSAPVWVPLAAILFHVFCILIYDYDCPDINARPKLFPLFYTLGSLLLQGVVQPIFCLFGAVIVCPLVSALIAIWTVFNYGVRMGWDSLLFYALIKPKGRLPSSNSWVVKRIMGPGLAPEFFFEISIEQALTAFQARLEYEELTVYHQRMSEKVAEPQTQFKTFFQSCFAPFSAKLVESEGPYKNLIKETQVLKSQVDEKIMIRKQQLETGLNVATRSRIRMKKPLLERTILGATKMSQSFYADRVFIRMKDSEINNFWESRGLEPADWTNLTILLMSEVFCQDFLTPLEEMDVSFKLETSLKGLPIPTELLLSSFDEEDLWYQRAPITMSKVKYQIHSPFLDVAAFNPMSRPLQNADDPIGAYMVVPLPILHPAYISVIVYTRETENPFSSDNPVSQAIIKALQDSGPTLNQDCISLDIDDDTTSNSSSGSNDSDYHHRVHTREDVLTMDSTPSPCAAVTPSSSSAYRASSGHLELPIPSGSSSGNNSSINEHSRRRKTPSTGVATTPATAHSSKISLATPEEINLEDVVLSAFGTSV